MAGIRSECAALNRPQLISKPVSYREANNENLGRYSQCNSAAFVLPQ